MNFIRNFIFDHQFICIIYERNKEKKRKQDYIFLYSFIFGILNSALSSSGNSHLLRAADVLQIEKIHVAHCTLKYLFDI